MSRRLLVLVCALGAAISAPAIVAPLAAGQDDEVFVDPGSPSGKEYELPIDSARQQAGSSTKKQSAPRKAPLFGEGVDGGTTAPRLNGGDRATDSKRTMGGDRRRSRSEARKSRRQDRKAGTPSAAAQAEARQAELARARALPVRASADGGIGVGGIIAGGVSVLLVGGLIGLWLRRRATT